MLINDSPLLDWAHHTPKHSPTVFLGRAARAYRDVILRFDTEEIAEMQESLTDRWNREVAQATAAKTRAEAVNIAVQGGIIDENEGRLILSGDPIFGELEEME